ncbi:uncharacterized protein LOC135205599 [Macrobrachium nipponense]|uniref:uncharacterized protein LOC135205599 n=1 Tax=Macrobrachium nipponense TaxID=159736 RepID=UPI0030C7F6E9
MILDNVNEESTEYQILQKQWKSSSNVLMFTNVPGKNTRLLKAQSAWGENLKAIISSLLSQEKKKKDEVNLALKAAGHWDPEITANQEKRDPGYLASDLLKMPEAAEIMQNTGLGILGPVPEHYYPQYVSGIGGDYSGIGGDYSGIGGDYSGMAFPHNYLMTSNVAACGMTPNETFMMPNITQTLPAQDKTLYKSVVYGFSTQSLPLNPQPSVGRSSKKSGSKNSRSGAGPANKVSSDNSTKGLVIHPKKGKVEQVEMCKILVKNMKTNLKENHMKQILDACGTVVSFEYPENKAKGRSKSVNLHVQYNNAKAAKRAVRILNFLKVFGANSSALVVGTKGETGPCRELHSEDRLIIPIIQDVIVQMQKEMATKTKVSIVAKKELVTTTIKEDTSKASPVCESKEETKKEAKPEEKEKAQEKTVVPSKPVIHVHVTNLSKYVPVEAIKEAMRTLGSTSESDVKQEKFICEFQNPLQAIPAVVFMNNYRLPDMKLKVYAEEPLDFKDAPVKPAEETTEQTNLVFKRYNDDIISNLREAVTKDINYFTYKTQICKAIKCKTQDVCHNYHNIQDRRRSPITNEYSCTGSSLAEAGQCHSVIERMFHLITFRAELCPDAVKRGVCRYRYGNCPHAHPETPEMFFHKHWENLYIEGLGETFKYVNGAIKNMFKLQNTTDLQVVVLTSTFEMVQLLTKTFQNVAKSCRQNVVAVSQYGSVANGGTIMISTTIGLLKLLSRKEQAYTLAQVKALIIDDGLKVLTALMNSNPMDENLSGLLSKPDVNKVVIDDSLTDGRVGVAAFVMKAEFKKLLLDRPRKKWEPLNPAAIAKEAVAPAAPSAKDTKRNTTAEDMEKSAKDVFKVPTVPVSRLKPKDNSNKGNNTNSEKTKNPSRKSRFDDAQPMASSGKNEEEKGKVNDALKLIMASYKDFQKGGLSTDPTPRSSRSKEIVNEKQRQSTYVESSKEKPKSWSFKENPTIPPEPFAKLDAKLVPYYSTKLKSKTYASIPFNYDGGESTSSSRASLKKANSGKSVSTSNAQDTPEKDDISDSTKNSRYPGVDSNRSSRKSPSSGDSSRSLLRDSRRSPASFKSSRGSPGRDLKRSGSPHASSRDSQKKRRLSPYGRSGYDDKKGYIVAELDLKEEHSKETKLFFDVPEVHPEFESKHKIFSERYEKQYPGKIDANHKEQRWQEFWKVIVTGMQEIAWREKLAILKNQFKMESESRDSKSSNKRKTSDTRNENDSNRKSSSRDDVHGSRLKSRGRSNSVERKSPSSRQNSDKSSPSRKDSSRRSRRNSDKSSPSRRSGKLPSKERERSKRSSSQDSEGEIFSVSHALNVIGEVCNHLGVLKPALQVVIDKISISGVNSKEAVSILTENDNALLIEMAYKRLESIAKTAPRGPQRNKLIKALEETKKLKEFAALKLQEMAVAATDSAISSSKNLEEDSSASSSGLNKNIKMNTEVAPKLVRGLDVNKIARATHEKGTEAIIEFIKNTFAYEGIINPAPQDINDIYTEVSRIHFQISLNDTTMELGRNTSERFLTPEAFQKDSSLSFFSNPSSRDESDDSFLADSLRDRTHMSGSGNNSPSFSCTIPGKSVKGNINQVQLPSSGVESISSFQPQNSVNENDDSSFQSRSSVQSNPSFSQGNEPSFPSNSSDRETSAFLCHNYLAQKQGSLDNQNSNDKSNDVERDLGSNFQPWDLKEKDKSTIDFMNQRLDFLLQDTRLQTSEQKDQLNETEESGFRRRGHHFSNQSNEQSHIDERFGRAGIQFSNENSEHNQMDERFGRDEQQFYSQNDEFNRMGKRFGRNELQCSNQSNEYDFNQMAERLTMGNQQFSNQNNEYFQMDERFSRGDRQFSDQTFERSQMDENRLSMGDMPFGHRRGYDEDHDFDMDNRNFSKDNYKMTQHFDDDQDNGQRNFHADRGYIYKNTSQFVRNEPYQDSGLLSREGTEFDIEIKGDLRNVLSRNLGENEPGIDINSMRIRGEPSQLHSQSLRGITDSNWGHPGQHMMHQRNNQQSYPGEQQEASILPIRAPSEQHIDEFLNRFR